MYYTIYKITNQTNGKVYIGSHKTKNLDDGYMGSGKYLKRAIEKNGIENFSKEILFVFDTPEEMYTKEAELVNEEFLAEANTYNLKVGGFGGFDYINSDPTAYLTEKRLSALFENNKYGTIAWKEKYNSCGKFREKIRNAGLKGRTEAMKKFPNGIWEGRKHTDDSKKKISEKASQRTGSKNSQFGTRWIHNLILRQSKKIKKDASLPDGWFEGRRIKFL